MHVGGSSEEEELTALWETSFQSHHHYWMLILLPKESANKQIHKSGAKLGRPTKKAEDPWIWCEQRAVVNSKPNERVHIRSQESLSLCRGLQRGAGATPAQKEGTKSCSTSQLPLPLFFDLSWLHDPNVGAFIHSFIHPRDGTQ